MCFFIPLGGGFSTPEWSAPQPQSPAEASRGAGGGDADTAICAQRAADVQNHHRQAVQKREEKNEDTSLRAPPKARPRRSLRYVREVHVLSTMPL